EDLDFLTRFESTNAAQVLGFTSFEAVDAVGGGIWTVKPSGHGRTPNLVKVGDPSYPIVGLDRDAQAPANRFSSGTPSDGENKPRVEVALEAGARPVRRICVHLCFAAIT